jgi:predicted ATPase
MITRLRAENFKSWKDTGDLRLGRLTGLFGTNSSGKTSILQILPLLKQTAENSDRNRVLHTGVVDSPVYLGTLPDILHGHRRDAALKFSFTWDIAANPASADAPHLSERLFNAREMTFRNSIVVKEDRPTVEFFDYEFAGQHVGMRRETGVEEIYKLTHSGGRVEKEFLRNPKLLRSAVKSYGFPPEAREYSKDTTLLPSLQLAFENFLEGVHYLGPLRSHPLRVYEWGGERPADAGWDGEDAIAALLAPRKELTGRVEAVNKILYWLREKMKLAESFSLKAVDDSRTLYQFRIKTTSGATEVLLPDVGFGVSQILPVLVNCAILPEGSTLLLEQPEIHLHPFAQAALADVLIDVIKNQRLQIIVESHSEHLLRRIQRRIAREVIHPDDVALYFCQVENGSSTVEELDVDAYGNIRNWPADFFGDEMGELADMTVAAMERQKAGRQ